jgi:hypothetical protein
MAGILHVFSGPDHLAAVAPLTVEKGERGWYTGLRWGLGHSSGVLLIGFLSVLLREFFPVGLVSSGAERLVGVVLIAIGFWGMQRALTRHLHVHEHAHGGLRHVHIHSHGRETSHRGAVDLEKAHSHTHAAFAVGTLHGLAGSSHFVGVLPALAFATRLQALGYLVAYGIGTIAAMTVFSSVVSWFGRSLELGGIRGYRVLLGSCSVAAMGVGGYWLLG